MKKRQVDDQPAVFFILNSGLLAVEMVAAERYC